MKILFIDDSQLLISSVKRLLSKHYIVDSANTGSEGIHKACTVKYSLILLDLGLPDMDGYEVCRALRRAKIVAPILVLSVQKNPLTLAQLLNSGADDYYTKPFNSEVLRARINALLRRSNTLTEEQVVNVKGLTVNVTRRQVSRHGKRITLRRKEFDILEYLILNRGRALTRTMILDHVWESGTEGWNNTVDVHIKHLRDKIDRPFGTSLIKTAYGIGYLVDDE
jgi:DNA-binding response OmpR family regulator